MAAGMRSIIWKELRENYRWALLGFIGMCVAMAAALGVDYYQNGFRFISHRPLSVDSEEFQAVTAFGYAVIGLALGLLQVVFEARGERFSLLVHRPATRTVIFAGKVLAGGQLYLFSTAVPFLLASWWAAIPGHVAGPFAGSMMLPGVVDLTLGVAFYFAGMLTGLREARWYASRGIGIVAVLFCSYVTVISSFPVAICVALAGVAVLATAAWGSFFSGGAPGAQPLLARGALAACLVVGLGSVGVVTCMGVYEAARELRITSYRYEEMPVPGAHTHFLPPGEEIHFLGLAAAGRGDRGPATALGFRWDFRFVHLFGFGPQTWIFDRDEGVIHQYSTWGLGSAFLGYIDPVTGNLQPEKPDQAISYRGVSQRHVRYDWHRWHPNLLVFSAVVYDSTRAGGEWVLFTAPEGDRIVAATQTRHARGGPPPFAHTIIATEKELVVLDPDGNDLLRTRMIPEWERFISVGVARLGEEGENRKLAVYFTTGALGDKQNSAATAEVIRIVSAEGEVLEEERLAPRQYSLRSRSLASDFAGPVVPIAAFALAGIEARASTDRWHSVLFERWYLFVGLALVSALATFVLTRRFSFSTERVGFWTTMGFVFGPVGLFTLLCLDDWPARECCDACGGDRLVTRSTCEHCGAEWPAPQPDGTEIFEAA